MNFNSEIATSFGEADSSRQSHWTARLVAMRETLLNLITGTHPQLVLNEGSSEILSLQESDAGMPVKLKRLMDKIRIGAIDEQGNTVDYQLLRSGPLFREYRQNCSPRLQIFDPSELTSREQKLAFWINLYNALIIDGVISGEITKSIGASPLALLGFFRKTAYNIAGTRLNADDIEHGILRGNRGHPLIPGSQFASQDRRLAWIIDPVDVRIHFALNCAGRSCPPIQVYSENHIDQQLDVAARNFVNADLQVDKHDDQVHISAIFKWFVKDFGGKQGVMDFLLQHLDDNERKEWIETNRAMIEFRYKNYDWGLNSAKLGLVN